MAAKVFEFGDPVKELTLRRHEAGTKNDGGWQNDFIKAIYISTKATGDKLHEVAIHESLHAIFPFLNETTVDRTGVQIAMLTWTGGTKPSYLFGDPQCRWKLKRHEEEDGVEDHFCDPSNRLISVVNGIYGEKLFRALLWEGIHAALPNVDESWVKMSVDQITPLLKYLDSIPPRGRKATKYLQEHIDYYRPKRKRT